MCILLFLFALLVSIVHADVSSRQITTLSEADMSCIHLVAGRYILFDIKDQSDPCYRAPGDFHVVACVCEKTGAEAKMENYLSEMTKCRQGVVKAGCLQANEALSASLSLSLEEAATRTVSVPWWDSSGETVAGTSTAPPLSHSSSTFNHETNAPQASSISSSSMSTKASGVGPSNAAQRRGGGAVSALTAVGCVVGIIIGTK